MVAADQGGGTEGGVTPLVAKKPHREGRETAKEGKQPYREGRGGREGINN